MVAGAPTPLMMETKPRRDIDRAPDTVHFDASPVKP
jgi:hypothetical protein